MIGSPPVLLLLRVAVTVLLHSWRHRVPLPAPPTSNLAVGAHIHRTSQQHKRRCLTACEPVWDGVQGSPMKVRRAATVTSPAAHDRRMRLQLLTALSTAETFSCAPVVARQLVMRMAVGASWAPHKVRPLPPVVMYAMGRTDSATRASMLTQVPHVCLGRAFPAASVGTAHAMSHVSLLPCMLRAGRWPLWLWCALSRARGGQVHVQMEGIVARGFQSLALPAPRKAALARTWQQWLCHRSALDQPLHAVLCTLESMPAASTLRAALDGQRVAPDALGEACTGAARARAGGRRGDSEPPSKLRRRSSSPATTDAGAPALALLGQDASVTAAAAEAMARAANAHERDLRLLNQHAVMLALPSPLLSAQHHQALWGLRLESGLLCFDHVHLCRIAADEQRHAALRQPIPACTLPRAEGPSRPDAEPGRPF